MTRNQNDSANDLSFSQRYGYESLPKPMQLEEISDDLRREIWNATQELLISIRSDGFEHYFGETESRFVERVLGNFLKKSEDEIDTAYMYVLNLFKTWILKGPFYKVLDLVEVVSNEEPTGNFPNRIHTAFEKHAAAYWLDVSRRPYHFFPRSSREQGRQ